MHEPHLVDSLQVYIDFENLETLGGDSSAFEHRLASFMSGRAAGVIDAVFDEAGGGVLPWRLERWEVDLGLVVVERADDWESAVAFALRRHLHNALRAWRESPSSAPIDTSALGASGNTALAPFLFFLRHGHLPWYGQGRRLEEPQELGRQLLRHDARGLVAALRGASDRAHLLHRLAAQFDDGWLAALIHALMPDEPSAAARLVETVRHASRPGHADTRCATLEFWAAALEGAVAHTSGGAAPDLGVLRLQLKRALEGGTGGDQARHVVRDIPAWRRLLRDDRAWLKSTLQRLGSAQVLERSPARLLPTDLLAEMAHLWLDRAQSVAVTGWISALAARMPTRQGQAQEYRHHLWEATLSHLWAGGGEANFDGRRLAHVVHERIALRQPTAVRSALYDDLVLLLNPNDRSLVPPAVDHDRVCPADTDWIRADSAWYARLRAAPEAMRSALRRVLQCDGTMAQRIAGDWSDRMLLEATCLQWPQARLLVAAAVASPPHEPTERRRRWICTLRQAYAAAGQAAFDETRYLENLVLEASQHEERPPGQSAQRWSAQAATAEARSAWIDRIIAVTAAPSGALDRSAASLRAPPSPATAATPRASPVVAAPAATPAHLNAAREIAHKVVGVLTSLASTLGRRLEQLLSAPHSHVAPDTAIEIDNAGLVLIGAYLPRLLEALRLVHGSQFRDDAAQARAVHLLQFALDGVPSPAPESRLVLNKLLCGVAPAISVDRRFAIRPDEQALIEDLLLAVIAHWGALGRTSVRGLRETFLQRRGRLTRRPEGGWTLAVEAGSYDMLLDRLPWGYAMQKYAWMDEVLYVEWR